MKPINKYKKRALAGNRTQSITAIIVLLAVAIAGVHLLISSHAESTYVANQADNGTLTEPANTQSCTDSTDGKCVQFGTTLAVHVKGDQIVDGQGKQIRLLGTNASDTEYCTFTHKVAADAPLNSAEADSIASWKMNAVRVPLNEDCWLGINGISINGESTAASAQTYQTAIENWVTDLNNDGIIAILDLHWSASGTNLSNGGWPMANESNTPAFWTQVAKAFKSDPAVMFDLYNEPYIGNSNAATSTSPWTCWLNGCNVTYTGTINGVANDSVTYASAGMQQLVSTVRATGATQPIMLGSLEYSSDPCGRSNKYGSTAACPELANLPTDPLHQLVIDYHNYPGVSSSASVLNQYWTDELSPLSAAGIPMVTNEFGENDCSDTFMNTYMTWADKNNESYLAWAWLPKSNITPACTVGSNNNYYLLSDWNGDPSTLIPQGANYKAHLAAVSPY
jgi:hypothetical protein